MNLNQQDYYIEQLIVSLRTRLLVMGASVEIAVDNMHKAVKELNVGTAQAVIENDDDIDDLENEIDESSLTLLAKSQPVAKDLRFVISCLRMVTDMERIGDEAAAICSQVILMDGADKNQVLGLLGRHLEAATTAFANAMNIVRDMDATKAREMNEHTDDDAVQSEVAVMDTVDINFTHEWLDNIAKVLGGRKPDYLVVDKTTGNAGICLEQNQAIRCRKV